MAALRRVLFVAACLVLAVVCVSATDPNTPADGADGDGMCMLASLQLSGLTIYATKNGGGFSPNKFHYTCSCDSTFTSTVVTPTMIDSGSSAEITFNGARINFRNPEGNAISNDGTATTDGVKLSPRTKSDPLTFVTGKNTIIVGVGCNGFADPNCYYQYEIVCTKPPASGGSVIGDPQFVGLRGQSYQVHGVSGEIYNIVSDADVQYNSRFVFLSQGECPVVNGRKQKGCYSHPGSYLGELGLKTRAGDKIHFVTGPAARGFDEITVNGKEVAMGETVLLAEGLGSVSRNTTHVAQVQIGNWDFTFENSDLFVNQKVRVLDSRSLRSHGLLGQTWRETTYPNAVKYIAGSVDDYVIRDNDIFGDAFVFNAFN